MFLSVYIFCNLYFYYVADLIAAGSDTVSVTLYWTLATLAFKPNVQAKIIQELDAWKADHVPGAIPSFHQDREAFPYTICVQKEMIRYRPATSYGIPHVASEDIVAGGYLIPKGAVLISSMGAMHMNESIYENAHSFDPERFKNNTSRMSASANSKVDSRDIFAFGWGRRMCLGIHLVSFPSPL
jgi:cytochrome P450